MLGGGGSSSSNTTSTQQVDKRLVVDAGVGVSSDSSTVTVNALDEGAIAASRDVASLGIYAASDAFARALAFAQNENIRASGTVNDASGIVKSISETAVSANANTLESVLGFTRSIYDRAFSSLDSSGKIIEGAGTLVAKAYDNAKGEGTQKTYIAAAALAVVALVGVKAFGK